MLLERLWSGLLGILLVGLTPLCAGQRVSDSQVRHAMTLIPRVLRDAQVFLNDTLRREADHARLLRFSGRRSSGASKMVQNILGSTKQAKQMSYGAFIQLRALKLLKQRMGLNKEAFESLLPRLPPLLERNPYRVAQSAPKFRGTVRMCPYPSQVNCATHSRYRSYDGSCNNLNNPLWGTAFQPLERLIAPDYADGIEQPRANRRGAELPSAREVSWQVHDDKSQPDTAMTLLVMLTGQFIDHDLVRTAISTLSDDRKGFGDIEDIKCGQDGCRTGTGQFANCLPIRVPRNDPFFRRKRCLEFIRTLCVPNSRCTVGPRQQLNQITSYLDASQIYGSTRRQSDTLRDLTDTRSLGSMASSVWTAGTGNDVDTHRLEQDSILGRGKLRMRTHPTNRSYKKMLPVWEELSNSDLCKGRSDSVKCFQAGDGRVNEHLGLMCLHTIFAREHNRIEAELHRVNPHWRGKRLYEETKRILTAMWQHIVYNEYIPLVLGEHISRFYHLRLQAHGYNAGYNARVQANIVNGFASAAFRYGHSQIQDKIKLMNSDYRTQREVELSSTFRSPAMLYRSDRPMADDIIRGFVSMRAQTVDNHLTAQVAGRLFSDNPPNGVGLDLASLNIQRGREHGIPGYAKWREWCGTGLPKTFSDLTKYIPQRMVDKLSRIYRHVEDVDLFPAGLSETPTHGAVMGPTFACILANQFQRTRSGDRFWYENRNQPHPFTPDQLQEIRKASMAKVICLNSDSVFTIQPKALLRPFVEVFTQLRNARRTDQVDKYYRLYNGGWNDRVPCHTLPTVDMSRWREVNAPPRKAPARSRNTFHFNTVFFRRRN